MSARMLVVLVILALLATFAGLNWEAFNARTPLNVLVASVEAPLGLVMLAVVIGVTALFALFALGLRASALLEERRHTRELLAQRKLAEDAEASRYLELRRYLEAELGALKHLPAETSQAVLGRLGEVEAALRGEVQQAGNTLAAYIGEMEDRLTRGERS